MALPECLVTPSVCEKKLAAAVLSKPRGGLERAFKRRRNAFVSDLDFYGIFTFLPILDSRGFLPPLLCA
jgi:hypothetical protein